MAILLLLALLLPVPLGAQQWDSPETLRLVDRAVRRRAAARHDAALATYRARAHGLVFFSARVGAARGEPARLIKADELEVEVYWRTPGVSKQVVTAWRDRRYLPTDISYHPDHLTLMTGDLPDRIFVGQGDEIRGVAHPLSVRGPDLYRYALADSLVIQTDRSTIRLVGIDFRPIDERAARAVGRVYLDEATGAVARMRLGFTAAAYRDPSVEDITILLENSLRDGAFWLPVSQQLEIRRRVTWFDFPVRSVIRVRWSVSEIQPNVALDPAIFRGPALAGLAAPADSTGIWAGPIDRAASVHPTDEDDLAEARLEVERLVGAQALETLQGARLGANSLSDLVMVNRVTGLRLGLGATVRARGVRTRAWLGYGTSDGRFYGRVSVGARTLGAALSLAAYRRTDDLGDITVISPILNSLRSQEAGHDLGDYVLVEGLEGTARVPLSGRTTLVVGLGGERSKSVAVAATPAHGSYRPNPALGAGDLVRGRLTLERQAVGSRGDDLFGALSLEGGTGGAASYVRLAARGTARVALEPGDLVLRGRVAWGSDDLPAYRSFVLGGRGTLPGAPFRAWGGRSMALLQLEWRPILAVPSLDLGAFATTGRSLVVAPFVAAGWSDRGIPGTPWRATGGIRPVAGLALEWPLGLVRLEFGVDLRGGGTALTIDVTRAWWPVL